MHIRDYQSKEIISYSGINVNITNFNTTNLKIGNTCNCSFLIDEIHYKFYIRTEYFYISKVELDIVLAKNIIGNCDNQIIRNFKNSASFLQTNIVRKINFKYIYVRNLRETLYQDT